ncbi:YagK/YfjJ domain-containing protein [Acinetobacter towneri]|uniref:YagK/YfjJ domain-containing protein n=1 Tax=Acinetobacter towneri TaxID=202956 RepID=UPI002578C39D|nr:inovirus-type Gp2 protein [Acinetobacter towneri]MDM1721362.1 inovirus-type Gp2 protein [Acinetobacter towneri]
MNEAQTLLAIENLMKKVIQKTYRWQDIESDLSELRNDAKLIYDSNRMYSPLIQAYFDLLPELIKKEDETIFSSHMVFKQFQTGLRKEQNSFLGSAKNKRKNNWNTLEKYFKNILSRHRKLLLVRVDLHYSSEIHPGVTKFAEHIRVLLKRIHDKDTIFKDQIGYAYRLEQGGKSRGYHCHLLVIYNGTPKCKDSYYGQEIGRLWKEKITQGCGEFYNCNQASHKRRYQYEGRLGIGMIERSNHKSVDNAFEAIRYLAMSEKADQYMRVWWPKKPQFNTAEDLGEYIDSKKS